MRHGEDVNDTNFVFAAGFISFPLLPPGIFYPTMQITTPVIGPRSSQVMLHSRGYGGRRQMAGLKSRAGDETQNTVAGVS